MFSLFPFPFPTMSNQAFSIGDRVRLARLPAFVKTADPMPMLRSANLLTLGEAGLIVNRKPGNYWSVRFSHGTYLLESQYLEAIEEEGDGQ